MKLAISGAHGRMGQTIAKLAFADPEIEVVALLEQAGHPKAAEPVNGAEVSTDNSCILPANALIEFTLPEGTLQNLEAALHYGVPMVIGTTGFTPEGLAAIKAAAQKIPIVFSSNMSVGVNTLFKLIEIASAKLDCTHIRIEETHHVHKKDKPSGTAKTMAEIAEKAANKQVHQIDSFREGEVIGDHTIFLETNEDILTISHHAKDRSMFAKGAILAAKYLQNKKPGLYTMQDVLGFNV